VMGSFWFFTASDFSLVQFCEWFPYFRHAAPNVHAVFSADNQTVAGIPGPFRTVRRTFKDKCFPFIPDFGSVLMMSARRSAGVPPDGPMTAMLPDLRCLDSEREHWQWLIVGM
jgi:hypothetical protein